VIALIQKIPAEYFSREGVGAYGGDGDGLPKGVVEGFGFDEEEDDI